MTRVLHTSRINGVMFVNRERRMVSLELSKEMEKDFFVTHTRDNTKNIFFNFFLFSRDYVPTDRGSIILVGNKDRCEVMWLGNGVFGLMK